MNYNRDLLVLLNTYRSLFSSKDHRDHNEYSLKAKATYSGEHEYKEFKTSTTTNWEEDSLFNTYSFRHMSDDMAKPSRSRLDLFVPTILINQVYACSRDIDPFLLVLIHSHRNNYWRRKAMRDTWLARDPLNSSSRTHEFHTNEATNSASTTNDTRHMPIVHLFFIGKHQSSNTSSSVDELIEQEAAIFKDIILIDIVESYHNIIYKHLSLINWSVEYCPRARFVLKLDDDVFVNLNALVSHLLNKFDNSDQSMQTVNEKQNEKLNSMTIMKKMNKNKRNSKIKKKRVSKRNKNFMYCNIVDKGIPNRSLDSKWYVSEESYPFAYYPRYCEGFTYITNMNTLRLMQQQSRMIPRFWIDDVYFTGLLLLFGASSPHDHIEWHSFESSNDISWSYYNFDDYSARTSLFDWFARIWHQLASCLMHRHDMFVILHSHVRDQMATYESNSATTKANLMASMKQHASSERISFYDEKTFLLCQTGNHSKGSSSSSSSSSIVDLHLSKNWKLKQKQELKLKLRPERKLQVQENNCFDLQHDRLSFYFYNIYLKLWMCNK